MTIRYNIYQSFSPNSGWEKLNTDPFATPTYSLSSLLSDTTYYVKIETVFLNDNSEWQSLNSRVLEIKTLKT